MHLPTVIKELFLSEFAEYCGYEIVINFSKRFGDNGGDLIVKIPLPDPEYSGYYDYIYYWFEQEVDSNGNKTGKITFEKEENFECLKIDISLKDDVIEYVRYQGEDIEEDKILEKFKKEQEAKIREKIAKKILSGEIELRFFNSDSDSYPCPPSKINITKL